MRNIDRLTQLCEKLVAYSKDQHPGLATWQMAIARTVEQIADEAINVTFGEQKVTVTEIASGDVVNVRKNLMELYAEGKEA
jgi:hypothetical protein